MAEIMARVTPQGKVELVRKQSERIEGVNLAPTDAAHLARGILACAAALSGANPPKAGTIGGDAHLPVMHWGVGTSNINGAPILILSVPSGLELTFQLPEKTARELGSALVARGRGSAPAGGQRGTVH